MTEKSVMTAEEAVVAEILQDSAKLVRQLKEIDSTLADKIRKSTEEGAGRAFTTARLRYEEMIAQGEAKLAEAGNKAVSLLDTQIDQKIASMTIASKESLRRCWSLLLTIAVTSLCSAIIGGIIVHYLER